MMENGKDKVTETSRRDRLDGIELRSEKMREVLGDIPRGLVWATVAVLVILTAAIIAAVTLIPSPYEPGVSILRHLIGWPIHG